MGAGLAAVGADPHDGRLLHPAARPGALYRRVLARYVQMATAGGSRRRSSRRAAVARRAAGRAAAGALSYIVEGRRSGRGTWSSCPVGINYDRVLEDRFLIRAHVTGVRRFRPAPGRGAGGLGSHLWQRSPCASAASARPRSRWASRCRCPSSWPGPDAPTERWRRAHGAGARRPCRRARCALVARHLLDGERPTPRRWRRRARRPRQLARGARAARAGAARSWRTRWPLGARA
jgi:hypothetical protein